jgi:hypothetical protein
VYVTSMLMDQTPLVTQALRALEHRFTLEPVSTDPPTGLLRVGAPAP